MLRRNVIESDYKMHGCLSLSDLMNVSIFSKSYL